jgi:anti-sigma B factor antagonist
MSTSTRLATQKTVPLSNSGVHPDAKPARPGQALGLVTMPRLTYQTTRHRDVTVIALTGELDLAGAARLEMEIDRVLGDSPPPGLVVDLSRLDFLDSSGLRLLILIDQKAQAEGRRFALVPGAETVQRVFDITRMNDRLRFVSDPAELAPAGDAESKPKPGE